MPLGPNIIKEMEAETPVTKSMISISTPFKGSPVNADRSEIGSEAKVVNISHKVYAVRWSVVMPSNMYTWRVGPRDTGGYFWRGR